MSKVVSFTETFLSHQGEGARTGRLSLWLRLWGCTLKCRGFGQTNPTDPSSYVEVDVDPKKVKKLSDLPLLQTGCDSAYSWDPKFKHLATRATAEQVAQELIELLPCIDSEDIDLTFTGGEPMMQQANIIEIATLVSDLTPITITNVIETNCTVELKPEFVRFMKKFPVVFSMSPKLFTVSGEKDAINLDIIASYLNTNKRGSSQHYLKFVVNDTQPCWDELDHYIDMLSEKGILCPIYVMPVGASSLSQESEHVRSIATKAMQRGLHLSVRMQNIVWNNAVGK